MRLRRTHYFSSARHAEATSNWRPKFDSGDKIENLSNHHRARVVETPRPGSDHIRVEVTRCNRTYRTFWAINNVRKLT